MSSKEDLCLWCGRFTRSRSLDGLADCDRRDCVIRREYLDEEDMAAGPKFWADGSIIQYDREGKYIRTYEGES